MQQLRACSGGAARKNRVQSGCGPSAQSRVLSTPGLPAGDVAVRVGGGQPEACGSVVCSAAPGGTVPVRRDVPQSGQGFMLYSGGQGG